MQAKAVVVTGAGGGVGRACVVRLSQMGFRVFAGIRRDPPPDAWVDAPADRIDPLRLDVVDPASIAEAAATVEAAVGAAGLAGLVNNAGTASAGPLEFLPPAELARQLEVNVVGQLAVTQAFLPALRRGGGRIVNLGSLSGRLALPFAGPYAASKAALRALNDAMRTELAPTGIGVSLVEAGTVATPIWEKALEAAETQRRSFPPEAEPLYGRAMEKAARRVRQAGETGIPAARVADAVAHAVAAPRPKATYIVAPARRIWMVRLLGVLPAWLRDRLVLRSLR